MFADAPAYDYSTSDEDDDYLQPPNSRSQTPPPCYSDIFDSDDSVSKLIYLYMPLLLVLHIFILESSFGLKHHS